MDRQRALELLAKSKPKLQERFGVTRLALFGSTARDVAASGSDVDILVAFDGPATSKRYFGVQFYLEDLFGCPVDLVSGKALRPELCSPSKLHDAKSAKIIIKIGVHNNSPGLCIFHKLTNAEGDMDS